MIIDKFKNLLRDMIETKIPDIHIVTGSCPYSRKHNGEIEYNEEFGIITLDDAKDIITHMLDGDKEFQNFTFSLEKDFSYALDEAKFRVNIFHDAKGYSIAIRYIPVEIPTLESLNISKEVKNLLHKGKGLILVTGPTGSGKSTTLAAMINYINQNFKKHIITMEDPIEFNFRNNKCLISQREIGTHSKSFLRAIKSSLREDPDVIMVGEMRDPETIQAALTLAETGHLVLSTLHTNDAVQSIDRIIDSFPTVAQSQIRTQLAMSLIGICSQILLPKKEGAMRIVAREVLIMNDAIKSLIIQGNTHQIYSIMELSGQEGMILMDKYLQVLFQKGYITKETFNAHLRDKDLVLN